MLKGCLHLLHKNCGFLLNLAYSAIKRWRKYQKYQGRRERNKRKTTKGKELLLSLSKIIVYPLKKDIFFVQSKLFRVNCICCVCVLWVGGSGGLGGGWWGLTIYEQNGPLSSLVLYTVNIHNNNHQKLRLSH